VIVTAGPVLVHSGFGMNAPGPVLPEMHRGRIIRYILRDFFKDRPEDTFLWMAGEFG
jgi:hypothetical protein